jgi:hypothetical protein
MAFKMKRSPAKNLGDFFGSIFSGKAVKGRQDAQRKRNTGEYEGMTDFEKRRAEKKSRKPGESKFQADVRRKREAKRAKRAETKRRENDPLLEEIKDTSELQGPKNKPTTKTVTTPKTPKAKQTFKQAFAAARKANKKTFNFEGKSYTTKLKEENFKVIPGPGGQPVVAGDYEDYGNPINKKNMRKPFKMKAGKAGPMKKNYGIGYRKVTKSPKKDGVKETQKNTEYFIKSGISDKEIKTDSTTFNKSLYSRFKPSNKRK